jgi:anti-sigma-K factor RskA
LNKEEFISSGLLELYATGISSPEETRIVEEYLHRYPELQKELHEVEGSLEKYAQAHGVRPPAPVKEKIFSQIFPGAPEEENKTAPVTGIGKRSRSMLFLRVAVAACLVLLAGSLILNYSLYNKYQNKTNQLQVALEKIEQEGKSNQAMSQDLNVMTNKYAQPVVLNGTANAPEALARIFWMKNTGQVYIDPTNLPEVPPGKQYQLWAIIDGKPVDGGMIRTEKGIYHIQKMKSFGKAEAFAITLEKAGGSPVPTMSEMIVSANL